MRHLRFRGSNSPLPSNMLERCDTAFGTDAPSICPRRPDSGGRAPGDASGRMVPSLRRGGRAVAGSNPVAPIAMKLAACVLTSRHGTWLVASLHGSIEVRATSRTRLLTRADYF